MLMFSAIKERSTPYCSKTDNKSVEVVEQVDMYHAL